jgi:hypothetical protein
MKTIVALFTALFLVGCSSTTSQYYEAVEKSAKANAEAQKARYEALASIANSGGGEASTAAVMALALSQAPAITPQPMQSPVLQWVQALASPVSSLGMMYMQTESTKALASYNRDVSLAQVMASSADDQALYSVFGGIANNAATANAAGVQGVVDVVGALDLSSFVEGIVNVAGQGFNAASGLGRAGINGVVDVSESSNALVSDIVTRNSTVISNIVGQNSATVQALGAAGVVCRASGSSFDGAVTVTCD